jgi:hypothetical protein
MTRRFVQAVLACVMTAAAMCAASARADDTPKPVDACRLVTKADAEKALAKPVGEPDHPVQGAAIYAVTSCSYRATSGGERVSVMVIAAGDAKSARVAYDQEKNQAPTVMQVKPQDVAGLGDAAFWEGRIYNKLRIVKGRIGLSVGISTETKPQGKVLDLAKLALSRLP